MTEQFKLGVQPPIRASGDIENSPGITIRGPAGEVVLEKGVICAMRHIHMSPEDALSFGLHDKDIVRVRVQGDRELIFGDVLVRVNPNYRLAMHIDTDEANAAHISGEAMGYLDGIQSRG
jgi:acetate kinase